MKYKVVTYGNGALRKKARKIDAVTSEIKELALNMLETMYEDSGVGLAAEQIAHDEAIFVIDILPPPPENKYMERCTDDGIKMPLIAVNPEIVETTGECTYKEGCLSFPGISATVTRPESLVLEYTDIDGKRQKLEASGLLAEAIHHENDHLEGVLIVDRMSPVQKVMNKSKLKRLVRDNK